MADGKTKLIQDIREGDMVLSRDPEQKGESPKRVSRTYRHIVHETILLYFENGLLIETTDEHPFYVAGKEFTAAKLLIPGDRIVTSEDTILAIKRIDKKYDKTLVFNFEVQDYHT